MTKTIDIENAKELCCVEYLKLKSDIKQLNEKLTTISQSLFWLEFPEVKSLAYTLCGENNKDSIDCFIDCGSDKKFDLFDKMLDEQKKRDLFESLLWEAFVSDCEEFDTRLESGVVFNRPDQQEVLDLLETITNNGEHYGEVQTET